MRENIQGPAARDGSGDAGFTLIELLVVIVILAILAAIVVFAVGGITDKGQKNACSSDRKTIQTAEEAYYAHWPTDKDPVYGNVTDLTNSKFLTDPPTLHTIAVVGDGKSYTIASTNLNQCSD